MGLSPLENLMAMYVGLELFGIAGFFLGPLGLLLIEGSDRSGLPGFLIVEIPDHFVSQAGVFVIF